ncbi:MAG: hypothetical protein LKI53_08905 [Bacteroidales bacterium]|jgi:dsDNA-specific endonuclease/ATPase MutS2|nr:hypothetical protein [Bacteroidales bacterium]
MKECENMAGNALQIGDTVRFLDYTGGGLVVEVHNEGKSAVVEIEGGLRIPVTCNQCVVIPHDDIILSKVRPSIKQADMQKYKGRRKFVSGRSGKISVKYGNVVEIDLHAEKILKTISGMKGQDILQCQMDMFELAMRGNINKVGTRIVFIHGEGDGILRHKIEKALDEKYPMCEYFHAPFKKYGHGATVVIIKGCNPE